MPKKSAQFFYDHRIVAWNIKICDHRSSLDYLHGTLSEQRTERICAFLKIRPAYFFICASYQIKTVFNFVFVKSYF